MKWQEPCLHVRVLRAGAMLLGIAGYTAGTSVSLGAQVGAGYPPDPTQTSGKVYRGLFGGGQPQAPRSNQTLSLNSSLAGSYQWTETPQVAPIATIDPVLHPARGYATGMLQVTYGRQFAASSLGASAGLHSSYSPANKIDKVRTSYNAATSYSGNFSARTDYVLNGGFSYSPFHVFGQEGPITGFVDPTDPTLALFTARHYTYHARASASRRITQRSRLGGSYEVRWLNYEASSVARSDRTDQRAHVLYNYSLARNLSVHAGYGYNESRYDKSASGAVPPGAIVPVPPDPDVPAVIVPVGGKVSRYHTADVGLGFGKMIALTQRTFFGFNTGSAVFGSENAVLGGSQTTYRLNFIGDAMISHAFDMGWNIRAEYARRVRFVDGFTTPFLTDSVTAGAGGYIGPRMQLTLFARVASSQINDSGPGGHRERLASVRLQPALSRNIAVFAQGYYSYYDFDSQIVLPLGYVRRYERRGVRAGLVFFLPILR